MGTLRMTCFLGWNFRENRWNSRKTGGPLPWRPCWYIICLSPLKLKLSAVLLIQVPSVKKWPMKNFQIHFIYLQLSHCGQAIENFFQLKLFTSSFLTIIYSCIPQCREIKFQKMNITNFAISLSKTFLEGRTELKFLKSFVKGLFTSVQTIKKQQKL